TVPSSIVGRRNWRHQAAPKPPVPTWIMRYAINGSLLDRQQLARLPGLLIRLPRSLHLLRSFLSLSQNPSKRGGSRLARTGVRHQNVAGILSFQAQPCWRPRMLQEVVAGCNRHRQLSGGSVNEPGTFEERFMELSEQV